MSSNEQLRGDADRTALAQLVFAIAGASSRSIFVWFCAYANGIIYIFARNFSSKLVKMCPTKASEKRLLDCSSCIRDALELRRLNSKFYFCIIERYIQANLYSAPRSNWHIGVEPINVNKQHKNKTTKKNFWSICSLFIASVYSRFIKRIFRQNFV